MVERYKSRGSMSRSQGAQTGADSTDAIDVEALFQEHYPRVYAYIRYRTRERAEAEDLTSEILERALTHLSSYDPAKGTFAAWLFRIAHNTWVNHLKRQRRRSAYHIDVGDRLEDLASPEPNPERSVEHKQDIARMLDSLRTLSARQQEILALRFAAKLTNREIARTLRMNERTVSVTILRALRKLRKHMEEREAR